MPTDHDPRALIEEARGAVGSLEIHARSAWSLPPLATAQTADLIIRLADALERALERESEAEQRGRRMGAEAMREAAAGVPRGSVWPGGWDSDTLAFATERICLEIRNLPLPDGGDK